MKKTLMFGILLFGFVVAGAFSNESPLRVATDAELLLGQELDRAADHRLFMESSVLESHENRITLNNYRTRFNAISGRIISIRHQINNALGVREPRVETISTLRRQLQVLMDEHDALIDEFRQWTSGLQQ